MIAGKPLFVWAGIFLATLLVLQIISGYFTGKGKRWAMKVHKTLVVLIILVGLFHVWFALRLWFF